MLPVDFHIPHRHALGFSVDRWTRVATCLLSGYAAFDVQRNGGELTSLDDAKIQKNNPEAVSPLKTINGTDVATYLESYASDQNLQDRDAQYAHLSSTQGRDN